MIDEGTDAGLVDVAVLDDDLDFRNYIEDLLRDEGKYLIRSFGHPDELFASAQEKLPDIVLLDMKMGTANGEAVVEELLSSWPNLCIIVVTGYPSLESMRATFKLRVFDYLAK
ncbi:MAG: response regulator, partial [Acidobacteriaceae bacterium]|nr:response regulator [Acidobacteriaceae bacterium]